MLLNAAFKCTYLFCMSSSSSSGGGGGSSSDGSSIASSNIDMLVGEERRRQVHCVVLLQQVKILLNDLDRCLLCHYLNSLGDKLSNIR